MQEGGAGLRKFFRFGLFLNSGATDIILMTLPVLGVCARAVETAVARCTSRCAMARGHRLNTFIVLAAVHGLSVLFSGGIRGRASILSSSSPPPPLHLSPSLISHLASVDVKQNGQGQPELPPSLIVLTVSVDVKQH